MRHPPEKTESVRAHILVAEDDSVVRLIVQRILETEGFTVDLVSDGKAVLEALGTRPYDLVLMDCLMPRMDGFETTRAIRGAGSGLFNPAVPVIAMTGLTAAEDHALCFAAGVDSIVNKPVDPPTLLATIRQFLHKQEHNRPGLQPIQAQPGQYWQDNFFDGVIDEFLKDVPGVIADLQQAVSQGEMDQLRHISHRFRGAADVLKVSRLSALSKSLEKAASEMETGAAKGLASELIVELQKLHQMMAE